MDEKSLLLLIYSAYLAIPNREYFFLMIYSILIISNISTFFKILFYQKIGFKNKLTFIFKFCLVYVSSYFLIKDPNPFYNLFFFYLPLPNLFKGIFIIIFVTFFLNNKVFLIKSEEDKEKEKDDDKKIKTKKYESFFLSDCLAYFKNNKMKFLLLLFILILIKIGIYFYNIKFWIYFTPKESELYSDTINNTKYYICSIICNAETIIVDWIAQMKLLIDYLGKENIYISILENADSKDNTAKYLSEFKKYLDENNIKNKIILEKILEKGDKERIVYLGKLRDLSMNYLYEIPNLNFSNTKIIFFNDIIYRYSDIIKLLSTNGGTYDSYDSVCGLDFYEGFYDSWASQLLDGMYFRRYYPYMSNKEAQDAVLNNELIRTFSCWNGVSIFWAKAFEDKILFFRHGYKIRQSECLLIHYDMQLMGYQKTLVNPNVKVAYTYEYYYKNYYLYPWTKNLFTYFYYYFRFLFQRRNYKMTNIKDRGIDLEENFKQVCLRYLTK